jgi:hypothetical protein
VSHDSRRGIILECDDIAGDPASFPPEIRIKFAVFAQLDLLSTGMTGIKGILFYMLFRGLNKLREYCKMK